MLHKKRAGKTQAPRVLIIHRNGAFEVYADPGVDAEKLAGTALSLTGAVADLRFVIVDYDADPNAKVPPEFEDLLLDPR